MTPVGEGNVLKHFVYLDKKALSQYVAALEGNLIVESKARAVSSGGGGVGGNVKILHADYKKGHEDEHSWTLTDPPEAQFERLLAALTENSETLGWLEITDPDADFPEVTRHMMISWECYLAVQGQVLRHN
jgi:hypothetical protein